jgi:hypothetical protein
VRVRAHALLPCHAQQGSEAQGRIEHRKTDRTLVVERKSLPKTWGVAGSRVCQNRKYGELPKRKMVKVKAGENSQRRQHHLRWQECLTQREQSRTGALSKSVHERCVW